MTTIKQIVSLMNKIKKTFDITAASSFCIILLYRISSLRSFCKSFIMLLSQHCSHISSNQIVHAYNDFVEQFLLGILAFYLIYIFLLTGFQLVYDRLLKKESGNNTFEQSLLRYINDDTIPRCYVLTGEWGSGKTYDTTSFFEKYYANSRKKVYRISCYGLETRNDLVNEIERTIQKQDSSLSATIINSLSIIPVIGDALEKLLKKTYSYDTAKKGSIFIFDDFERVVSKSSIRDFEHDLYKRSAFFPHPSPRVKNDTDETIRRILEEFSSIDHSNRDIERLSLQIIEHHELNKYNVIVGLINDLIEKYSMKAIIICNTNVLGEKFVDETLQEKLNCVIYRKHAYPQAKSSLIDNILNNRLLDNETKSIRIKKFITKVKEPLCTLFLGTEFENLRLFGSILEAFTATADLIEVNALSDSFLTSLLNSIIIVHRSVYGQCLKHLSTFKNGASIEFLMKLYELSPSPLIEFGDAELKWVDLSLSSFWIFNLPVPTNIGSIIDNWASYAYYDTDKALLDSSSPIDGASSLNLYHILYIIKNKSKEEEFAQFFNSALETGELFQGESLQNILDVLGNVFPSSYPKDLDQILKMLVQEHAHEHIIIKSQIHRNFESLQLKSNEDTVSEK